MWDTEQQFLGQFENQLNLLKGSERIKITRLLIARGEDLDLKTKLCKEKNPRNDDDDDAACGNFHLRKNATSGKMPPAAKCHLRHLPPAA
jgi:hypothetical protein